MEQWNQIANVILQVAPSATAVLTSILSVILVFIKIKNVIKDSDVKIARQNKILMDRNEKLSDENRKLKAELTRAIKLSNDIKTSQIRKPMTYVKK